MEWRGVIPAIVTPFRDDLSVDADLLRLELDALVAAGCPGVVVPSTGTRSLVAPSYGAGSPWYESGPEPVFAQAALDRPSRFIRVMILPRSLTGKSSLQLVNEADKAKPRSQQYKIFADAPIELPPLSNA